MKCRKQEFGFTVIETAVVLLLVGIVIAIATPKINNALREYRLNTAVRQISDTIQRAKMQAMSDNQAVTLRVDTANKRAGIVVKDSAGNEVRTDYVPLPQGITFALPANVTPPMTNAPFSKSVSFPAQGTSTTVFQQDFNSRGFPAVATAGAINAIYLTNSKTYKALTLTSVGGISIWIWQSNQWVNSRVAR
jgi:Tfp pilus assembly protein FimT